MEHNYLGVPAQNALRSRTPPPLRTLELTGSGSAYTASRTSANRRKYRQPPREPFSSRIRRRPRLWAALAGIVVVIWLLLRVYADWIALFRFKLRDRAYEDKWITSCGLRKRPMLFIRASDELTVVWESNCDRAFELHWAPELSSTRTWREKTRNTGIDQWRTARVKRVRVPDDSDTHFVYQAVLRNLEAGQTYAYSIHLNASSDRPSAGSSLAQLARHTFIWRSASPDSMQIAVVADNQYNVRTFHRILITMLSYFSRTSTRNQPDLLVHAGDQVQNPDNLAQWQTDFWEALTSILSIPLGQSTPILLARGNHDWDETGLNAYTGGSPPRMDWLASRGRSQPREHHVGTYLSYSLHPRCRIIVLDSNLDATEQVEQEEWLEWELKRDEWTRASLRLVMVHVPPFLEYWDRNAWTEGKESEWSSFVRHRLTPLLSQHGASLVISGHQHAYSRGQLPHRLHADWTRANSSSSLPPIQLIDHDANNGTVYVICGGAGGTLDTDRVEQWHFYDSSVSRKYHFGWMGLGFAPVTGDVRRGAIESKARRARDKAVKTYRTQTEKARAGCAEGDVATDVLEWRAVGLDGIAFDAFRIEGEWCRSTD